MDKVLDDSHEISGFQLQSCNYVHLPINNFGEMYETPQLWVK